MLAADASRSVREEELALMPFTNETPPVTDSVWATYIASVVQALKRTLGDVHSLTTRGDGGLVSSVIVAEVEGLPVRAKIERIEGCVLALDIVVGREIDEVRGATVTLWAIPERSLGQSPAGPPAAPLFKTGDRELDLRFKVRGSALAFNKLFDEDLRSRAVDHARRLARRTGTPTGCATACIPAAARRSIIRCHSRTSRSTARRTRNASSP